MQKNINREVGLELKKLIKKGRYAQQKHFVQHGKTSVYRHSLNVAVNSLRFASLLQKLHIDVDEKSLVRGALLHDYFLYDWHDKNSHKRFHGLHHAATALRNAKEDFDLTKKESDIISHHMFPLGLHSPKSKEAWIVCLTDKVCAIQEMIADRKSKRTR